jgi:phosphoribosylformylglycinamidine synthase
MRAAVIIFPGSNCDRDMLSALRLAGHEAVPIWHKETELPKNIDLIAIPGGFSFGDYLRCGAIAAKSPIFREISRHIERGGYALGICNGFQILTEAGILPGILQKNIGTKFISKIVDLRVINTTSTFTHKYLNNNTISIPIAHHEGNYFASKNDLEELNHIIVRKALERKKRPVPLSAYVRELVKKEIECNTEEQTSFVKQAADKAFKSEKLNKIENG